MRDADGDGLDGGFTSAVLEALFTSAPLGLYVLDGDLRVLRYNTAARGLRGLPVEEVLGRRLDELVEGFRTTELAALAREVLATGRPLRGYPLRGRLPDAPEREAAVSVSVFRLEGLAADRHGLAVAVEDVTEQEAARDRLDVLHEAHRLIGTTLDAVTTAEQLAEVVVPALADAAVVHVLDELLRGERRRPGPVAADRPLRRAAVRTADPGWSLAGDALETLPFATPFSRALEDGQARLMARLDDDGARAALGAERADRLAAAGVHSLMTLPLTTADAVQGVLTLYRAARPEAFTGDDLDLAEQVASRGALSIDNACSYLRERTTATALQRHLVPGRTPELSAVETAHLYLPATAGGDWFDVIPLSGARAALVVGDVFGHGLEAAAAMGQLRTAVRSLAVLDLPPDELLARLDETAARLDGTTARPDPADRSTVPAIATCVYAVYDPVTRQLTAARAGHPEPLLVSPDGTVTRLDLPPGAALGAPPGQREDPYEALTIELAEGTVVGLYTDGLVSGDENAPAALRRILAQPDRPLPDLVDAVAYALASDRAEDDAVLLLARTRGLPDDRTASWTLPHDPAVVATARELVRHQLAAWELTGPAFETELIVSELVTNAIRYSEGPVRLRLVRDRRLICEVSDSSSTSPHLRHARATDEGGRGLFLVRQLSERWGTRYGTRGKTVWTELALPED
ncbi:SpoIIE family protein phosphatase [Kitasatospora sp. NPDC101176]|uniref:ATP-binding SpoIIE family protein phosphatase n=1 Tax=Kitasatospora sp. NPDC101176 TaxID=3364099 RepID=UPI00382C07EA